MTALPDHNAARPGISEVSSLIAWARRLSDAGIHQADPADLAAFHHAKQMLLERIQAPTSDPHQPADQAGDLR